MKVVWKSSGTSVCVCERVSVCYCVLVCMHYLFEAFPKEGQAVVHEVEPVHRHLYRFVFSSPGMAREVKKKRKKKKKE